MATKTRCSATTRAGNPCRAWAVAGTEPPRCAAHAGLTRASPEQGRKGAGAPAGNQNRRTHGFYARTLTDAEISDLVVLGDDLDLTDEITCARILLRRIMAHLGVDPDNGGITAEDLHRLSALALQATRTIARLLSQQRTISGEAADGIAAAIGPALDELSNEWGLPL